MPKFKLGDEVYFVYPESVERREVCPDCCGSKFVTITMGDGTQYTVDCEGCKSGYDPPRGFITEWDHSYLSRKVVIGGMEITLEKTKYHVDVRSGGWWSADESDLFLDPFDAQKEILVRNAQEAERITAAEKKKANPNKSWAWHVSYFRRELKRAHGEIERYTRLLNASKEHSK